MKIKEINTELPDSIKEIIVFNKKLINGISKSLGIPKKYLNKRNTEKQKIMETISGTTETKINLNKIQEVIVAKKQKNKTKEEIGSNLKDISDLYNIQGKELAETKRKLRDAEGDIVIKDVIIKEKLIQLKQHTKKLQD